MISFEHSRRSFYLLISLIVFTIFFGCDGCSTKDSEKSLKNQKTISKKFSLIPSQKMISFISHNIEDIKIYGLNELNQRALLGTTNSSGRAEITIPQQTYKMITFSYSLQGATVFTMGPNKFTYEDIPRSKTLKAIPDGEIVYEFTCVDNNSKEGIGDVVITSSDGKYSDISDSSGFIELRITPSQVSGPFIGENLQWLFQSASYVALDQVTTTISTVQLPTKTVVMKRSYSITILALEGENPLPEQYITINDNRYSDTDENGTVTYHYCAEDLNKSISIAIEQTEGRSAKAQWVKLGRISRTITLQVKTIHQFIRCLDTATNEIIRSVVISGSGVETNMTSDGTKTKILFPKLDDYSVIIKDAVGLYHEKPVLLGVNNENIGDTRTIYLDPVSEIIFYVIDANVQHPISSPTIEINGQVVEGIIQNGKYTYTFERNDPLRIDVQISAKGYVTKRLSFDRQFGIISQNIELDTLYAMLTFNSQDGNPAKEIVVRSGNDLVGTVSENGQLFLHPDEEGQTYNLTIISESGLYYDSELEFLFDHNGMQINHILIKRPWLEFRVLQPTEFGDIAINGVTVTSSTGQVGMTDVDGIFRYRIVDVINPIIFDFEKSGYELIELEQIANQHDQIIDVAMPRLEAFFYVRDSRTQSSIPNVPIWVAGIQETFTDNNGRANIFPPKRPMDLSIEARPQGQDYFPRLVTIHYTQTDLGVVYIEPRPIKLHVVLRWAGSGIPVNGRLEIIPSHLQYNLEGRDQGRHTFNYYNKNEDPRLIVTASSPTNHPFSKEVSISLAMARNGEIDISLNLQPKPRITVDVDNDVLLSIYRHTINNTLVAIKTGLTGGYTGELPDYGEYTFVRYSGSFVVPDSIYKFVIKSNEYLDLKRQPHCNEAEILFASNAWEQFIVKVNQIPLEADCYGSFNKKAAEVCKDELKRYKEALSYYQKIASGSVPILIEGLDPKNDPYVSLNMLECCCLIVEKNPKYSLDNLEYYETGKQQANNFDMLLQLLQDNSVQAQAKKELLYCRLLIDEFWSLDPRENVGGPNTQQAKVYRKFLYEETIEKIEEYQSKDTTNGYPSLQTELEQLRNTSPWP